MKQSLFKTIIRLFQNKSLSDINLDYYAIERLKEEEKKQNKPITLEVQIKRDKNLRGNVYVGFIDKLKSGVGLIQIHPDDLDILQGGNISYSKEEGKFLYFPNFDLKWEITPNPQIHKIVSNKLFTNIGKTWNSGYKSASLLVYNLLSLENVISLYANEYDLQIEFKNKNITPELEEEISEIILNYFSNLYPRLDEQ